MRKSVFKTLNQLNLKVWELNNSINSAANLERIRELNLDLIVIIAGNQIIKKDLLEIPKHGIINAHSSLLPKYKGLMPTFWSLQNEESETGVTVFFLNEGIDDGPIINQGKIAINNNTTQEELVIKSKQLANELLIDAMNSIDNGNLNLIENSGDDRYYKFPTREDVKLFKSKGKKFF